MTNEEKILGLLEAQGKTLEAHGKMLEAQGKTLEAHGKLLGELKQDVSYLKQDVREIRVDIENRIDPTLQALAEGQKTMLETLAPKNRVDALEEEVDLMKTVIRALSKEVAELKKAQ